MIHQSAYPINRLKWPTDWNAFFLRTAPLYLEIGFGNGQFLVELAKSNPEANIIGVEISMPSIKNAERKIKQAHLEHVALVRGSAQAATWLLFDQKTFAKVFINFPDPWPKPSHYHRRLLQSDFLDLLASRMLDKSLLEIATDHKGYAEWIDDCLSQSASFNHELIRRDGTRVGQRISTKYERKALERGQCCYYFLAQRNSFDHVNSYQTPEELAMPHAVLQSPVGLDRISEQFKPMRFAEGEIAVRFIACYYSEYDKRLVVDTFVHETPLEQRVLLSIAQRKQGDLLLSVHEAGYPRSTPGIHLAVHWLARWIQDLEENSLILRDNLRVK